MLPVYESLIDMIKEHLVMMFDDFYRSKNVLILVLISMFVSHALSLTFTTVNTSTILIYTLNN